MRMQMLPLLSQRGCVLLGALAACNLSVDNPDRVKDPLLDDPGAHAAVVAGASLALSEAINWVAFFGGDASKEFTQGGRIHPVKLPLDPGQLSVEEIPDSAWNSAQQARWVAEDAVRRFRNVMGAQFDSYDLGAKALLYAGYANRLLGENMCEAVIDGGAPSDYKDYFRRAESALTEAITVARAEFGYAPWCFPTNDRGGGWAINLSTGRVMRLVEAEIARRAGDWPTAMSKINGVRTAVISDTTGQPLAPWPATNITESWTALKRERGIELWLEARRLGDERRWVESNTPGDMEDMSDRVRLCFPIGLAERRANANVGPD